MKLRRHIAAVRPITSAPVVGAPDDQGRVHITEGDQLISPETAPIDVQTDIGQRIETLEKEAGPMKPSIEGVIEEPRPGAYHFGDVMIIVGSDELRIIRSSASTSGSTSISRDVLIEMASSAGRLMVLLSPVSSTEVDRSASTVSPEPVLEPPAEATVPSPGDSDQSTEAIE